MEEGVLFEGGVVASVEGMSGRMFSLERDSEGICTNVS